MAVDGDALGGAEGLFAIAKDEFVLLTCEVKDVYRRDARVGHDHATARIDCDAVGPDQVMYFGRAGNQVKYPRPEAALEFHVPIGGEAALIPQASSTGQGEFRHVHRRHLLVRLAVCGRWPLHNTYTSRERVEI